MTDKLSTTVESSVANVVDDERDDSRAAWVRKAIHEKIARDTDRKRHVFCEDPVELEFTEFEALFIANVLWDHADHSSRGEECKWLARTIHEKRKTREDGF